MLQVLGTPTEDNWPGISRSEELAGYKFPAYAPETLVSKAPRLDTDGIALLTSFLRFEAKKRLPARDALRHPYFSSFPQEIALLKDGKISCIELQHHPPQEFFFIISSVQVTCIVSIFFVFQPTRLIHTV